MMLSPELIPDKDEWNRASSLEKVLMVFLAACLVGMALCLVALAVVGVSG